MLLPVVIPGIHWKVNRDASALTYRDVFVCQAVEGCRCRSDLQASIADTARHIPLCEKKRKRRQIRLILTSSEWQKYVDVAVFKDYSVKMKVCYCNLIYYCKGRESMNLQCIRYGYLTRHPVLQCLRLLLQSFQDHLTWRTTLLPTW